MTMVDTGSVHPQTTIYLIRHGETEVNRRNCVQGKRIDPPLNERGRQQAKHVGIRFQKVPVDWVVTSTSMRAIETGAAISQYHSEAPFEHFDELNELEFGDLEGTHVTAGYNDLIKQWDIQNLADIKAPGERGESPKTCAQRALSRLQLIVDGAVAKGRRHVCVVVHSRLIQILMAWLIDGSLDTMLKYKQKKAAVNEVLVFAEPSPYSREGGVMSQYRFVPGEINSVSHMPDDVVSRVSSATSLTKRNPQDERIRFVSDQDGNVVLKHL